MNQSEDLAKIAEILIEHGINMNIRDVYGCTALHRVAEHGNLRRYLEAW